MGKQKSHSKWLISSWNYRISSKHQKTSDIIQVILDKDESF